MYDFDGRVVAGPRGIQPLISAEKSPIYIPLKMRRPAAPVRMGKIIVDSFTNILFGENRFPTIKIEGDELSQDFAQTIARIGRLPMQMIRARNLGGSTGSVGLSWCFHQGVPRFEVHNSKNLYIHSWVDRVLMTPKHVTEVYMFYKVKWDGKQFNKSYYWFRRDWTPDGDFIFKDVLYEKDKDPYWEIDEERSNRHGDGIVHFEWIQNLPTDEIDGLPDYEGLFDQFDQLDILNSVVTRGAILNLDPTLKLKMDPEQISRMGIRKGSDNALIVGLNGDASYLELTGGSITAGNELLAAMRRTILETAQCIVPDPSEVAAQGVSSVAIKTMYAPMLSKADILREQYAQGITRVLENMIAVVKAKQSAPTVRPVIDPSTGGPAMDEATGQPLLEEVQFTLSLPAKIEMRPKLILDPESGIEVVEADDKGAPVLLPVRIQRMPGEGGEILLTWPPYFAPTYTDQSTIITAMQTATGGKPFLSVETATDIVSSALGVDPAAEKKRVEVEGKEAADTSAAMFPPAGGGFQGGFGGTGGAPDTPNAAPTDVPEAVSPPIEG